MTWSDIPRNPPTRTLRQFAAAWLLVFLALGAQRYFFRGQHEAGIALAVVALAFGLPGFGRPATVRWLFIGCMVAAFPVGWVVSHLLLLVLFYGLLTPLAALLRLRGRDPLGRKPAPGQSTFWTPKSEPQDLRNYFRPY